MTDVVVVGGGIIGLATARALCLRGVGVTVLERGMVASGTSSRGEGNMLVSDKEIPAEASLALRSLSLWREFAEQSTVPFEYEEKGGIITARTDRHLQLLVAQSRRQSTLGSGIASTVLDREDLLGAEPNLDPGLLGGIHYPQDAQVMPIQASQALAFAVEDLGGTIRTGMTVTGLSRRGEGVAVHTGGGDVLADQVVNATGPWARDVARSLGGDVSVFPRRGLLLVTERMPPGTVRHKVYDGRYVEAVGSGEAAAQIAPVIESTQAGTILVGSTREAVGWDRSIPWALVGRLAAEAASLFPVLADALVLRTYQGFRPATPDHLPMIGPDAEVEGLFHHTGHEGAGIGLALGSAELLAHALLDGRVDPAFDPRRVGPVDGEGSVGDSGTQVGPGSGAPHPRPVVLAESEIVPAGPTADSSEAGEVFCAIGHCFSCVVGGPGSRTTRSCLDQPPASGTRAAGEGSSTGGVSGQAGAVRGPGGPGVHPPVQAAPTGTPARDTWDTVVIGAGPGGMTAATWAAKSGARVLLLDRYPRPGGQIARQPARTPAHPVGPYARMIDGLTDVEVWGGCEVTVLRQVDDGFQALAMRDGELVDVRARTIVLATGAREIVSPFPGWTLPGVMTVGGVQAQLKRTGQPPGRRIGLAGTGPLLLAVAAALTEAGAAPQVLAEQQPISRIAVRGATTGAAFPSKVAAFGRLSLGGLTGGAKLPRFGWRVASAVGGARLRGVVLERVDDPGKRSSFALDVLGVSGGLVPDIGLALGLGCETRPANGGAAVVVDEDQQTSVPGVYAVGEVTGVGGADKSVAEGYVAGRAVGGLRGEGLHGVGLADAELDDPDVARQATDDAIRWRSFADRLARIYPVDHSWIDRVDDDTVVCRCEGVPMGAVRTAIAAGATTPRAVKGLTRCGMGYCQGAVCGPLLASATGHEQGLDVKPLAVPVPLRELARLREDVGRRNRSGSTLAP